MKKPDKQIFAMLKAFKKEDVLKAISLYTDQDSEVKNQLKKEGWYPEKEKPTDKEFYLIDDKYWVQSDELIEADRLEVVAKMKEAQENKKVKEETLRLCEIFGKDGGFVFNTVHNVQANVPVENLAAMIDGINEFNG